ncbi:hypothetical protein RSOLAG22IIIB_11905 [Rhizoctonia solani]|uniref:DUF6532 domain-containing protein n=1 Tax=Rhizoctonia solani TaxID=456999 RepID=A0A0K6GBA8_9AGAM|nr:hypothetical protein RSOLAG22IIIB_11905 [Rhizoctonia solani]
MPKANARPKRARKDTEKIAPFRAEVEKHKTQRASRKRSKAQREDYSLDIEDKEERESEESDLPDVDEIGRSTTDQQTRRELLIQNLQAHGDFDVSEMDESELTTLWTDVKRSKKASKSKLFGKTSKVVDNAPAHPAISPKKKRARSPSPVASSKKRSHSVIETQKQPKPKVKGTDQSKGARGEARLEEPSKPSKPRLSTPRTGSRNSSRAPSTLASSCAPSSSRSSKFTEPTQVANDEDSDDEDSNANSDSSLDSDEDKGTDKDGSDEDGSDEDSQRGEYDELSDRPTKHRHAPTTGPKLKGKVKSGDFTSTERVLIDETVRLVQCHILLVDYFVDRQELFLATKQSWELAVRKMGEKNKNFPFYDDIFRAVKVRIHAFRGHLCTTITDAGGGLLKAYGLEGHAQGSATACEIIDSILPHGVHVKPGSEPGFGYFQHKFILEAIYRFPVRFVTLVCSIMHGVLDKFRLKPHPGNMNKEDQLSLSDVLANYKIHRKSMRLFKENQRPHFNFVFLSLPKLCFERAGVFESATIPESREVPELTANDFAQDEPTEEEMIALGLPPTTTATSGSSHPPHLSTTPPAAAKQLKPTTPLDNNGVEKTGDCPTNSIPASQPEPPLDEDTDETGESADNEIPTAGTMAPWSKPTPQPKPTLDNNDADETSDTAGNTITAAKAPVPRPKPKPRPKPTSNSNFPSASKPSQVTASVSGGSPSTSGSKSVGMLKSPRCKNLVVELSTAKPTKKGPTNIRSEGTRAKATKSTAA